MKIALYSIQEDKKNKNKSFQREIWDDIWAKNSFEQLVKQLGQNATYWKLKELITKNDRILEAGCGYGQWVYQLSQEGYKIRGIDNASKTIKKVKKLHSNLKLDIGDVEKLPYKNNSFDVYLSFGVIEHFIDGPDKVLEEAYRVLKPGGLLFLTLPYLNLPRLIRFGFINRNSGAFYQYFYSKREVKNLIKDSGFVIKSISGYDFYTAVRKDFPFLFRFLSKVKITKNSSTAAKTFRKPEAKFTSNLIKFLYKLDSYILLIIAYKPKK